MGSIFQYSEENISVEILTPPPTYLKLFFRLCSEIAFIKQSLVDRCIVTRSQISSITTLFTFQIFNANVNVHNLIIVCFDCLLRQTEQIFQS